MNLDWFGDQFSFISEFSDSNTFQRLGWSKTQTKTNNCQQASVPNICNNLKKRSLDILDSAQIKQVKTLDYDSSNYSDSQNSTQNSTPIIQIQKPEIVDLFILDQENIELKQEIILYLQKFNAHLENTSVLNEKHNLKIRCFLNHIFNLSFQEIKQNKWCKKCEINLEKVNSHCLSIEGILLSNIYESELNFKCKNNHTFSLYHKNWMRKWCQQCNLQQKSQIKQFYLMEEKRIQDSNLLQQEKLFKEARITMQQKLHSDQRSQNEQEIENAKKQALILAQSYNSNQQQQLQDMFKVHIMSETTLSYYLKKQDDLKQEYRKLSLSIHPDKNNHQLSADTFKKLNHVYQQL